VKEITVSSGNGQATGNYHSTSNLLNGLNLPAPTRGTVMKVTGNGVPGAVGQGHRALLSGLEMAGINRAGKIRQGFGSGSQGEFNGGCLSAVAGNRLHWTESLWITEEIIASNTVP